MWAETARVSNYRRTILKNCNKHRAAVAAAYYRLVPLMSITCSTRLPVLTTRLHCYMCRISLAKPELRA
jgi:hypothetical protein